MKEILNETDRLTALGAGWELAHVYDSATKRVSIRAFPTQNNAVKSSDLLHRAIAARAMQGDQFARRIFTIINESNK